MTKFQITAPDGQKFVITAPEGATAEQAYAAFQKAMGEASAAASEPPEGAVPGSREYADWARDRAMAGEELPQVSNTTFRDPQSSILDPLVQGTTFGFADELRGAVQGGLAAMQGGDFNDVYAREVDAARQSLEQERRTNPVGSFAAEFAGAIPTSLGLGGQLVNQGGSLLARGLSGAGVGAGQGAVYGFGSANEDRGAGALAGAGFGLAGGAVFPLITDTAAAGFNSVRNALGANRAARQVGMDPAAARFLETRLIADDALGPTGQANMSRAGNEAMLVDAGPAARNTLDYAIQSSGGAGRVAREALGGRVNRDAQAIQSALDNALGTPQGIETTRAAIRAGSAGERGTAYAAAYAQPIDYSSQSGMLLDELLTRVDPAVINRANALMRTEGEQSAQILAQVADDGTVTFMRRPDVRQIDYITRALNEEAASGIGAGAMGGQTQLGRALGDLSENIRTTLRNHIPEYDNALNVGRESIRLSQAVEQGGELLRPGTTRETVAGWARNLNDNERAAMAQGIRSQIDDALANVARTVADDDTGAREAIKALRDLSTRANREKVSLVIGEEAADDLFRELDRAAESFNLRAATADNSKTFQRQEMNRQMGGIADPDTPLTALGKGEPLNAGKRIAQALTGLTPERAAARQDEILTEVVRGLTAQGVRRDAVLDALMQVRQGRIGDDRVTDVARALSRLGGVSGYSLERQFGPVGRR